ncbi:hypothetical protein E3N88_18420 [Mikania micrantha]|uniref:Uncharacterized protein n=1 Tax=Mikania micrantha TaxID=192012 RepID=A0A5N6NKR4_9ASTR|nr:hypothetical protein E3N88_18420 [Mikania micrantha]
MSNKITQCMAQLMSLMELSLGNGKCPMKQLSPSLPTVITDSVLLAPSTKPCFPKSGSTINQTHSPVPTRIHDEESANTWGGINQSSKVKEILSILRSNSSPNLVKPPLTEAVITKMVQEQVAIMLINITAQAQNYGVLDDEIRGGSARKRKRDGEDLNQRDKESASQHKKPYSGRARKRDWCSYHRTSNCPVLEYCEEGGYYTRPCDLPNSYLPLVKRYVINVSGLSVQIQSKTNSWHGEKLYAKISKCEFWLRDVQQQALLEPNQTDEALQGFGKPFKVYFTNRVRVPYFGNRGQDYTRSKSNKMAQDRQKGYADNHRITPKISSG